VEVAEKHILNGGFQFDLKMICDSGLF